MDETRPLMCTGLEAHAIAAALVGFSVFISGGQTSSDDLASLLVSGQALRIAKDEGFGVPEMLEKMHRFLTEFD